MAKKENNVADKTSKKIKIWLFIVSFIFFFPFIGVFINEIKFAYICDLYTLGLDRKDFFTVWIALFGAIGIAFNIYQNHLRTTNQDKQLVNQNKQLEKQAEQIQLQGTQIELQSKSQRDSRFSKGVELLGNSNESARTGAAYSLFFLAKDYPEEFKRPVFEVLCSHIRSMTNTEEYKTKNITRPSNEIQSVINLLFQNPESIDLFKELDADLMGCYLKGVDLIEVNFTGAKLSRTNLEYSFICDATLENAFLVGTKLQNSTIKSSNLSNANLENSDLKGAYLSKINLSNAKLSNAELCKVTLSEVNLSDAQLIHSNLSNATITFDSKLVRTTLTNSNLSGANLSGADLTEAKLNSADLSNAQLYDCILIDTFFSVKTNLAGVDLSEVDISRIKGKIDSLYTFFLNNKETGSQ